MNERLVIVAASALAVLTWLGGCDRRSPEMKLKEQLMELRFEQKGMLDELYQRYGHGELASAVKEEAQREREREPADEGAEKRPVAKELWRAVGNAALEVDRAAFDSHCAVAGRGERPTVLSDKGRAFFTEKDVLETCKAVAKLEIQIDAKEAELARLESQSRTSKENR